MLHHELVDVRVEEQNLVPLDLEVLEVRRYLSLTPAARRDEVVNLFLVVGHPGHVLVQRDLRVTRLVVLLTFHRLGAGLEPQKRSQRILVQVRLIAADALLQEHAHLAVPLDVLLRLLLRALAEELEHALGDDIPEPADQVAILQRLSRDVEGYVLAVHDAAHPTHELRQQTPRVLLDQHPSAVQREAALVAVELLPREPSFGVIRRGEEERSNRQRGIRGEVKPERGGVDGAAHEAVERGGVLVGHLGRAFGPQRVDGVGPFAVEGNRETDECAVFLQHGFNRPLRRRQGFVLLLDVQRDACAACWGLVGPVADRTGRDGIRTVALGAPFMSFPIPYAREHVHAVGHHERGVEPDSELADDVRGCRVGGGLVLILGVLVRLAG